MANSTRKIEARSAVENVAPPKINSINIDVFTMILEEVIEDEADEFPTRQHWLCHEPNAAMKLALVCKIWKNIVYSTPRLWRIIKIRMNLSVVMMQKKLNTLSDRARSTPVDLYIREIHSSNCPKALCRRTSRQTCCCGHGNTQTCLDFTRLSNVRRLFIHFRRPTGVPIFDPSALPFLKHVKGAEFDVRGDYTKLTQPLDLDTFLSHTNGLLSLRLCWVGLHNLSWAPGNKTHMINLRTLSIGFGCPNQLDNLPRLAQILSHAPNIEELVVTLFDQVTVIPVPPQFSKSVQCLPKLRKIDGGGLNFANWLLTDSGIKAPNLRELTYKDRLLRPQPIDVERFWNAQKSIRTITLRVVDGPEYDTHIFCASNIEELTLEITGPRRPWFSPLCTPRSDRGACLSSYICPNLRVVSVIIYDDSILPSSFEDFVRSRCKPVDENGYTVAGCKAIELLKLQVLVSAGLSRYLSATKAWQEANVRRISDNMYELRWLRPETVIIDSSVEGGGE